MSLRFRKSAKIGPVKFTASKSGISASAGVKGFRVTKKANGKVQTAVSIPGTGLSSVSEVGTGSRAGRGKKPFYKRWWFICISVLLVLYIIGSRNSSSAPGKSEDTASVAATETAAPQSTVNREPTPEPVKTYILNPSTNVFHTPSCQHVKRMKEENKVEMESTYSDMIEQGYTPCDTCNPR